MNNRVTPLPQTGSMDTVEQAKWEAELSLGLSKTLRGSVLKQCRHKGPLYVQKAFYPEGKNLAHIYLLHPPGGMVSGDDLKINVDMENDAQTLITTPGAGRVYKARADRTLQAQHIQLRLGPDSTLEWLPLENIIYPGANTQLNTDIHLEKNASVIAWEISCLGLTASNQPFTSGSLRQRLQVFKEGRLTLREALVLKPDEHNFMLSKAGLANCSVNALMIAGPFDVAEQEKSEVLVNDLQMICGLLNGQYKEIEQTVLAAISLNGEFIQIRYLGNCSEQARLLFIECWEKIRPQLIERNACEPRIWAT